MNLTRAALAALLLIAGVTSCSADARQTQAAGPATSSPTVDAPRTGTSAAVAADVPALVPGQVSYARKSWGDPKTEAGSVILAPAGWRMEKLSTFEVRFTSTNKLWNLRVNGQSSDQPVKTLADRRYQAVRSVADFRLISRVNSTTKATNPAFSGLTFHHTTLTYSYTDPVRGRRLVVDRIAGVNGQPNTLFELSAGGRPQDSAALAAIADQATADFIRLP